jgi:hypothetical protein
MKRSLTALRLALGFGAALGAAPHALAQAPQTMAKAAYAVPRTSFGHPSFEGVWTQNFLILMEASSQTPMLVLPEPAAAAMAKNVAAGVAAGFDKQLDPEVPALMAASDGLPIVRGERRTRSVVEPADGKLPYTELARKESNRGYGSGRFDDPEQRPNWERCVTSLGLPPVTGMYTTSANPRRFVQTTDAIVIHTEYGDEARIIPLTNTHKPASFSAPLGDAIARWEADTLIIETVRLPANDRVRAFSNLIVPPGAKVIERYTRVSDEELLYQYTVEDPETYTAPWLAEYSLYRTRPRMYEHACHEGNYSLPNILRAERIKEQTAPALAMNEKR